MSRVIFEGRILGGMQKFYRNPYLNSATVPFDKHINRINLKVSSNKAGNLTAAFDNVKMVSSHLYTTHQGPSLHSLFPSQ